LTYDSFCPTQAVYDEIVAHARAGKPQEVCGILRGRGSQAFQVVRGRNVAPDPVKDYTIDPQTLLHQFDFEEGDEMVAIYHSHPTSAAYPSASDAWNAHYPDCAYLICSLVDDAAPLVRAFRLIAHDLPLDLAKLRAELDFYETRPGLFAYYQAVDTPILSTLQSAATRIPLPFYVVFELSKKAGKNPTSRIVSILEHQIQTVPD
jgi:proteasome lid subunit RPN8/RPN11